MTARALWSTPITHPNDLCEEGAPWRPGKQNVLLVSNPISERGPNGNHYVFNQEVAFMLQAGLAEMLRD